LIFHVVGLEGKGHELFLREKPGNSLNEPGPGSGGSSHKLCVF